MEKTLAACIGALVLAGCQVGTVSGGPPASQAQPVLSGDACALLTNEQTCDADTKDGCHWIPTASPCYVLPDGGGGCPGSGGACVGPVSGGGDGGQVCEPSPISGSGGSTGGSSTGGTTNGGTSGSAVNPCAQWTTEATCQADTADDCYWFLGPLCPTYILPDGGTGGCTGTGSCVQALPPPPPGGCDAGTISGSAGCACAQPAGSSTNTDSYVCMEQIGGPAVTPSSTVDITCAAISSSCTAADRCQCITGQGTCTASPTVVGLCVCDNGMR